MRYVPGLDGLRALAVIAVLLFHGEFGVASGGFLGVSLFFTLSGFLITTLLIDEHESSGTLSFRRFYGRRVRRLLPAAYLCLALVMACSAWWAASQQRRLPGDVVAAVANVANWRFAFSTTSYQDLFVSEPSPVAHFWSLAIEEQIYLVLPVIVFLALRRGRRALALTTGALLVGSVAATLATTDRDLVYNGTHTRAAELLVGVALAQVVRTRTPAPAGGDGRLSWLPGLAALGGFVALVGLSSVQQSWIYRGGLVGVAVVSAVLIAAVVAGRFPAPLLATRPLVAIGKVSYGIYLFHWPVFLLLDESRTGLDRLPLFVLRCVVTAALTVASYVLLEQPIRRGAVLARDRMMAPTMVASGLAVAAAAVLVVPTPTLTPTEQLLALGDREVVDFSATPVTSAPADTDPERDAAVAAEIEPPPPVRLAVIGSDPGVVSALEALAPDEGFEVSADVRPECPLSSVDVPGCADLPSRWQALVAAHGFDVLVLATGEVEAADALAKKVLAVTDAELVARGVEEEAMIGGFLATIDAALDGGAGVVWSTPPATDNAFFRHVARIGVERPAVRTVIRAADGGATELGAAIAEVSAGRPDAETADSDLRVLVVGDSTSLNFAQALHDGSDGRLAVLWAGANGCPFAPLEATRGSSDGQWAASDCAPWHVKVPPLLDDFDPDVLFVMTGPMELVEHRFAGDPEGHVAGDPEFAAARDAELERLLAELPAQLPVLVADLPPITIGGFSSLEMTSPERLEAVNAQIVEWDDRVAQVARFPYRETLEAAEAARPIDDQIRSDGTHPDVEPLAELARSTYVEELIALSTRLSRELSLATSGG